MHVITWGGWEEGGNERGRGGELAACVVVDEDPHWGVLPVGSTRKVMCLFVKGHLAFERSCRVTTYMSDLKPPASSRVKMFLKRTFGDWGL